MGRLARFAMLVPLPLALGWACASSGSSGGDAIPCSDGGVCPPGRKCTLGICVLESGGTSGFGGNGGSGFGGSGGSSFGGSGGSVIGGSGGDSGSGGSSFGGSGGSGGSSFGGSGGNGGTGGTGGSTGMLGRACATTAECGSGLFCATANSGLFDGGGPAKGYCTLDCTTDDTLCGAFDPNGVCLEFANGWSFCVAGCSFGPDTLTSFSPNKCHGRQEVACAPLYADSGTPCSGGQCPSGQVCGTSNTCLDVVPSCLPQCNSNQDCGSGLYCDPSDGLCRSTPATGKSIGATCTLNQDASTDECKGNCIGYVHNSGSAPFTYMCSENCTTGALPACGWDGPSSGTPAPATCLFSSTVILNMGGPGYGDLGSCGQLCDCNSGCSNPAMVCQPFGNAATESFFQRKGYCTDPLLDDGGLAPGIPTCL